MVRSSTRSGAPLFPFFVGILAIALSAGRAGAQLIPIRTVPVASGDQFRLVPSARMGMGAVQYALDDSLADGWSNPARGGGRTSPVFLGSPTFYGISDQGGGGRSFPVAGLFGGDRWFGGATLALQQVEDDGNNGLGPIECCWFGRPQPALRDRFGRNVYVGGFVGRRLGDGPWSVGVGVSAARLEAMDGVDLLYAGSERIEQSGDVVDVRVGLDRRGERDRIGAVIAHNRVSMTHDVTWREWVWDDSLMEGRTERRVEVNEDRTHTWAGQVTWDRHLSAPGWRIGAAVTANRKSHPKIPNYAIQNIPRDPGTTWAFEGGFGLSRTAGATTFALDIALQPIWSDTWQEADTADVTASEGRLAVGDRSIENDFSFTNVLLRTGLAHRIGLVELQAGLEARSYAYTLEQVNWVDFERRTQDESWVEWSPTFGTSITLQGLDVRYGLRVTHGTGIPGLASDDIVLFAEGLSTQLAGTADFIIAPESPLTLRDARVVTHQISVAIPVR
jgi:hypothetical protein